MTARGEGGDPRIPSDAGRHTTAAPSRCGSDHVCYKLTKPRCHCRPDTSTSRVQAAKNSQRYDRSLQQQIGGAAFLFRTLFFVFASPFGFLQRHPCVEEGSKVVRPRQHQHLQAVFVFFSFVPLCRKGQAFGCFSARKAKHKFKLDLKLSS